MLAAEAWGQQALLPPVQNCHYFPGITINASSTSPSAIRVPAGKSVRFLHTCLWPAAQWRAWHSREPAPQGDTKRVRSPSKARSREQQGEMLAIRGRGRGGGARFAALTVACLLAVAADGQLVGAAYRLFCLTAAPAMHIAGRYRAQVVLGLCSGQLRPP